MSKVNVNLDARLEPDGSVRCHLECDRQVAIITFTGTDVLVDVPEEKEHRGQHEEHKTLSEDVRLLLHLPEDPQ